jgi:hypothetical protein
MRVHVDEPGAHDEAISIECASRLFVQRAWLDYRDDASVAYSYVSSVRRCTSAIDY